MILIGITGKAGAGKNTVAEILRDEHAAILTSFAYPIKKMLNVILGSNWDDWEDRVWKETRNVAFSKSPRQMAQTLGTEWGRTEVHPNLWVILALRTLSSEYAHTFPFGVITDVRFANEAESIHAAGGIIIHVDRADNPNYTRHSHISESGIPFHIRKDFSIANDGDIDELSWKVRRIVERLEPPREKQNETLQSDIANTARANY